MKLTSVLRNALFAIAAVGGIALAHADTWSYGSEVDQMTSKTSNFATLISENSLHLTFPYQGDNYGFLTVRSLSGKGVDVLVRVKKGQILCPGFGNGCTVTVRFDQAPAVRYSAIGPNDNSSDAFFILNAKGFVARALKAQKILIQFTMYSAGDQTLEFIATAPLVWGAPAKKKK